MEIRMYSTFFLPFTMSVSLDFQTYRISKIEREQERYWRKPVRDSLTKLEAARLANENRNWKREVKMHRPFASHQVITSSPPTIHIQHPRIFSVQWASHPLPMKLNLLRQQGNKSGRLTREMRHKSVDSQRTHKLWSHGSVYPESALVQLSQDRHLGHMWPVAIKLPRMSSDTWRKQRRAVGYRTDAKGYIFQGCNPA